ncbi:MAG: tyrosine-type recombinase/integrase [Acidimicrobiales bacterium]
MPDRVLEELSAHLARTGRNGPDDLVFQASVGGPVRAANFRNRVYDPALRRADLEGLSFHRLCHPAKHMLRELRVPLEVIQKRLGHSSIRTTAHIYGSLPERLDRPVAEKLDEMFRPAKKAQSRGAGLSSGGADVVQAGGEDEVPWHLPSLTCDFTVEVTGFEPATSTMRT